jgi:hypothetical protein
MRTRVTTTTREREVERFAAVAFDFFRRIVGEEALLRCAEGDPLMAESPPPLRAVFG